MALLDSTASPSRSMLRWFGASLAGVFILVAFMIRQHSLIFAMALVVIGMLVGIVYYAIPTIQLQVIRVWRGLTYPLAWTMSHVLLGTVFFLIVLPIGWLMRLRGYDPLQLRKSSDADPTTTNWTARRNADPVSRYFKQF